MIPSPKPLLASPLADGMPTGAQLAALDEAAALHSLGVDIRGLSSEEAQARLSRFGSNALPAPAHTPWYWELTRNFLHLLAILLWIAAALAWAAGMPQLSIAILLVVIVNGVFSYWQQFKAHQAVDALNRLIPQRAHVRRNGVDAEIAADVITIGDILLLGEGDAIAADARLLSAQRLRVDNSSLTGESRPASRRLGAVNAANIPTTQFANLVLAGTTVTAGRAEAVVYATGKNTEFGRLAKLTHEQPAQISTLQREMQRITRLITVLALATGLLFLLLGRTLGQLTWVDGFVFALGIIVANVPEGLLPTLSLALALGVRRMAARKAIVKRLEHVETLGAVTTIVTDKTGTITENEMTVCSLWTPAGEVQVTGSGYKPSGDLQCAVEAVPCEMIRAAALCCDARLVPPKDANDTWAAIGDPMEAALITLAGKAGLDVDELKQYTRIDEIPFDALRKRMLTFQQDGNRVLACMKGATEQVLNCCTCIADRHSVSPLTPEAITIIESARDRLAQRGWRVSLSPSAAWRWETTTIQVLNGNKSWYF